MTKRATKRRYRTYKRPHRRRSLSASNWGPFVALAATILGIAGLICLIVFVGLPKLLPLLGVEYRGFGAPTPTPQTILSTTPTPDPMEVFDPVSASREVVFDGYTEYSWFADPVFYDGTLLLSAGKLVDNKAVLGTLLLYDPESRTAEALPVKPVNTHIMYAKRNDKWLTYLDANLDGGGAVMAADLTQEPLAPFKIKDVYTGQPEIMLSGDYIAWTDRTGTRMDKLYVCDLTTLESTTLVMFSASVYGESLPCLRNGTLVWADTDSGSGDTSTIQSISLDSSTIQSYAPGTYVHDPQSDSRYTIWLDAHHAEDTNLYFCENNGTANRIDSGVVQAGLGDGFVAYSKGEAVYAYVFRNRKIYRITPERESDMFLGVSENRVIWMDVTSRERDIVKFAEIPAA